MSPEEIGALSPVMPLKDIFNRGGLNAYSGLFDPDLSGSASISSRSFNPQM